MSMHSTRFRMKRMVSLLLSILLVGVLLSACTPAAETSSQGSTSSSSSTSVSSQSSNVSSTDPILAIFIGPLTGDSAEYGKSLQNGIQMAVDQWNEAGGYEGRLLEVEWWDDGNKATESVTLTNKALELDPLCVLGPFSSTNALAMSPILVKAEIIHYAISSSHQDVTKAGEWVFQGPNTDQTSAQYLVDLMINDLGAQKVAILYANNDWGNGYYAAAEAYLQEKGLEITEVQNYLADSTLDYTPMISNMMKSGADTFFIVAYYNAAATILKQLDTLNFAGNICVSGTVYNESFLPLMDGEADGIVTSASVVNDNPDPLFQDFKTRYQARTGGRVIDMQCVFGYDCTKSICDAITAVGPDRQAVRDYLATAEFEGACGVWRFNDQRQPIRNQVNLKVVDNQWTFF